MGGPPRRPTIVSHTASVPTAKAKDDDFVPYGAMSVRRLPPCFNSHGEAAGACIFFHFVVSRAAFVTFDSSLICLALALVSQSSFQASSCFLTQACVIVVISLEPEGQIACVSCNAGTSDGLKVPSSALRQGGARNRGCHHSVRSDSARHLHIWLVAVEGSGKFRNHVSAL